MNCLRHLERLWRRSPERIRQDFPNLFMLDAWIEVGGGRPGLQGSFPRSRLVGDVRESLYDRASEVVDHCIVPDEDPDVAQRAAFLRENGMTQDEIDRILVRAMFPGRR